MIYFNGFVAVFNTIVAIRCFHQELYAFAFLNVLLAILNGATAVYYPYPRR